MSSWFLPSDWLQQQPHALFTEAIIRELHELSA
jgi:hypothetical protein